MIRCEMRTPMSASAAPVTPTAPTVVAPSATSIRRRPSVRSGAAVLMAAFLLSRLLGMVRSILFTAVFGSTGPISAAYITAFRAPELIFNLVSGGALTSAFLPTFAGYLAKKNAEAEDEAWRVASAVFFFTVALLTPLLVAAIILAPRYVPLLVPSNDPTIIANTIPLTRIMLIQPLFMALITLSQGVANSYLRFTAPALAPLVYNLTVIVGIVLGKFFGIQMVAWSVTVGAVLQLAVQLPYLPQARRLLHARPAFGALGVREIGGLMLPRMFGQAGIQASFIATTALANLLPARPNAVLSNSWTLILLPVGIFAAALGTTAFPVMARQAAVDDREGFAKTLSETLRMVFFLTIPAAAGLIVLAPRVIRVLFAYGLSDNELTIHLTILATIYYAVGIPGHALAEVLPRAFYAIKQTRTPVLTVIWTLALAIFLSTMAVKIIPGNDAVGGLALAISIAVLVEAAVLILAMHHTMPEFALGPLGWSLAKANIAAGIMTAGIDWLAHILTDSINISHFGSFVALAVCVPFGAALYLGCALLLGVPEARQTLARIRARLP
jgi:putative peptidoglycan lipid II flippase